MKKKIYYILFIVFMMVSNATFSTSVATSSTSSSIEIIDEENTVSESSSINMISVEGGAFYMGSETGASDQKPLHEVNINKFLISKYEITQEEYEALMNNNPSKYTRSNRPVELVTWYNAIEFCNALSKKEELPLAYNSSGDLLNKNGEITTDISEVEGYRLPTEAEWEFAAKGANKSEGYKYSGSDILKNVAWYRHNSNERTHEVGTKAANEIGIYDMSGNVSEWCTDWYHEDAYEQHTETNFYIARKGKYKVIRGGNNNRKSASSKVVNRDSLSPTSKSPNVGFRIARSF